ncbi:MAG: hypothetical protein H6695_19290 [Deferribacteres bacterium]|nr:hypothetical protein [Deferribacteres bacterium]
MLKKRPYFHHPAPSIRSSCINQKILAKLRQDQFGGLSPSFASNTPCTAQRFSIYNQVGWLKKASIIDSAKMIAHDTKLA